MENGNFAERWVKLNKAYGAQVQVIAGQWGEAADPKALKAAIDADVNQEIKAVYVTHNETSTGVVHDVKALREAVGDHPAIFVVDSISGMAVSPLPVDQWKLDVVVSAPKRPSCCLRVWPLSASAPRPGRSMPSAKALFFISA